MPKTRAKPDRDARRPPLPILDARVALVPFVLYFWWPLIVYFAVQSAAPVALFLVVAATTFTIMADGAAGWADIRTRFFALARGPVVIALVFLLLYFALSVLWANPGAPVIERSVKAAGTLLLAIGVYATVPRFLADTPPGVLVTGVVAVSLLAIVDGMTRFPVRSLFPVEMVGSNHVAGFVNFPMVTFALLSFPIAAALTPVGQRALAIVVFAVVFVAAIATSVFTAAVALAAGLGVVAVARVIGVRRAAQLLTAATILYALAAPWLLPNLDRLLGPRLLEALRDAYAAERIGIWEIVAGEARRYPFFGQGLESLEHLGYRYGEAGRPLGHAHSLFLQVWAEGGLFGVLLLCAVAAVAIDRLSRLRGSAGLFGLGWAAALIAAVSFDFGSLQSWMHVTIALTAVALVGIDTKRRSPRPAAFFPGGRAYF